MFKTGKPVVLAILVSCTLVTIVLARRADASPILITSRGALGANDFKDWGTLGPSFMLVNNPLSTTTNGGLAFEGSTSGVSALQRLDQGNGINGTFSPGDHVLSVANHVSFTLDFGSLIRGGGAQFSSLGGGPFTARITALDAGGNTLATFTEFGFANTTGDGSAIFIGLLDTTATIDKLVFSMDAPTTTGFAINTLSLTTQQAAPSVPEPTTLTLLALGAATAYLRRRMRG